jgi:hypothetical protein
MKVAGRNSNVLDSTTEPWVMRGRPFEHGRPFGAPGDPAFRKPVLLSALRLPERDDGPVIIEDFPDEDPRDRPDPAC